MIHNKLMTVIILFSCVRLALQKPGSINGLKSFFELVSTNANVVKETNPVKQQLLLRYPVNHQKLWKLKSLMKNQINLIAHLYFQKLLLLNKTDHV